MESSTREVLKVVYEAPHVEGKRNLNKYLKARAQVQALKHVLSEAIQQEGAAYRALNGGDLARAQRVVCQ